MSVLSVLSVLFVSSMVEIRRGSEGHRGGGRRGRPLAGQSVCGTPVGASFTHLEGNPSLGVAAVAAVAGDPEAFFVDRFGPAFEALPVGVPLAVTVSGGASFRGRDFGVVNYGGCVSHCVPPISTL